MKWYHWAGLGILVWFLLRRTGTPGAQNASAVGSGSSSGSSGFSYAAPAGGGGGGGSADYSSLAAAIQALAAGVQLPNIQSVRKDANAGDTELVAATGGQRVCVLAYSITGTGSFTASFRSGGADLWKQVFDAPAGASGANLATAWPGFLFAGATGQNLSINLTGPATVSVTYWQEAA